MQQDLPNETSCRIRLSGSSAGDQTWINLLGAHLDEAMASQNHVIAGTGINHVVAIGKGQTRRCQAGCIHEMTTDDVVIPGATKQQISTLTTNDEIAG